MDANDIRRNLEAEYDIPFVVQNSFEGGEPAFIIGPKDTEKELFTIKLTFRNQVRLYMDFVPQKYSAEFIESMSRQPEENRIRFLNYAKLLSSRGAKCEVSINHSPISLDDQAFWPDNWNDIRIHVTKMPIIEDGELDYAKVANEWGSIFIGMILSLADIVPAEEDELQSKGYAEGTVQKVEANRYERNPLNRKLCLLAKGYDCEICGMNFEKQYGEIGHHFIHVHHIVPVSKIGSGYVIDPIKDLIPVCPNCHAMLHRSDPPILPEMLIRIVQNVKRDD